MRHGPVHHDAFDDTGLVLSDSQADDRGDAAYEREVPPADFIDHGVHTGVWVAEPGTYTDPEGIGVDETYVVLEGTGEVEIGDSGPLPLKAGAVVSVPARVPSTMRIATPLRKFYVIGRD